LHGDDDAAKDKSIGNLRALAGIAKFPVRVKCALLGFDALKENGEAGLRHRLKPGRQRLSTRRVRR